MVNAHPAKSEGQKPHPARSIAGMVKNIGIDGARNQIVPMEWLARRSTSRVSCHNQIIDSTDTSGSETINAPRPGKRRAVSEASAIRMPEMAALKMR